jgi:RHS repeat-associated protein
VRVGGKPSLVTKDPNGNQLTKTTGGVTTTYTYDTRDKLAEVTEGASTLARFQYDAEGRLLKKIGAPTYGGDSGVRQYVYDQTSRLLEYDGAGATVARFSYGSDRLISMWHLTEGTRFYHLDGLRSVVNLTDDAGATVASYHLDAWGNFRFPTELTASANRFAFTGHVFDAETGLYYAKARFLDPKLGRFLTQDSFLGQIDEPPSLHRYVYGWNRPTFYVDPTGHGNEGVNRATTPGNEQDAGVLLQQMADNPQPWHQTGPQNAPDPAVVEETTGEKPGLLARLWAAFNGTEQVAKGTETIVGGMARQALNADKMSDEAADRARALAGDNSLPSGMTEEDVRNIAQGDRGAVRSGAASAVGGFAGVSAGAAYEAAKQYAVKKAAEAVELVAGAGTRLKRIFRCGSGGTSAEVRTVEATAEAAPKAVAAEEAVPAGTRLVGRGDPLKRAADWVKPQQGAHDVLVHGTPESFQVLHNGKVVTIDQRSLATFMKKSGYSGGDVRLLSCSTGACDAGAAQNLANKLGAKVTAPTDTLWIHRDGTLTIGPNPSVNTGTWRTFAPGKK